MASVKHQYYHNGVDSQKKSDITIDLKRVDRRQIKKWDKSQNKQILDFLETATSTFNSFVNEIKESIK